MKASRAKPRRRGRPVKYPRYFSRFLEAFHSESRAAIESITPERWTTISASMVETLVTPEGKLPDPKVKLTPRQLFFQQLRLDFDELHTCFETLSEFPALSRMPWPRHSSLTANKVIVFWRETHFNECYIYHLRFLALLTHLERAYPKDSHQQRLVAALADLGRALRSDFSGVKTLRGRHVHQFRHRQLDAETSRLSLLELLARDGQPQVFRTLYFRAVRAGKAINVKRFKAFNQRMRRELNGIFRIICLYIVSDEGRLIYPSQLKH